MDWVVAAVFIFGIMLLLLLLGVPVAFTFLFMNILGALVFWGGSAGMRQLVLSIWTSISTFTLLPVPLFILMGEIMFRSGVATQMMDALDKWIGRLPGRLSVMAVAGGTVFSVMSGSSMASIAMLGSILIPEMEKRGYKNAMSLGPIIGSGCLAVMIPPTALGIILASLAQISIGKLLIAIIIPGLLMAALYAAYIVIRALLQPHLAPAYDVPPTPLAEKLSAAARHILPIGLIVFLVIGVVFIGIATPSEAAALGALGCFAVAAFYGRLNWFVVKKSAMETLRVSAMVFMIFAGAAPYAQLLAFTGVTANLVELATVLPMPPMATLIAMQIVVVILGMFMESLSILMVCLPIYMPIVNALGFDPVWFGVIMLVNVEIATISPPFGLCLFAMKAVAPPRTTMMDVYRCAIPYCLLDFLLMGFIMVFPQLALWPVGMMK
jgi:tripartite ATP-independent transporter DctM subunit